MVTATPQGYRDDYYTLTGQITVTNEIVEPMSFTVTDVPAVGVDDQTAPDEGFVELGAAQWNADGVPAEFNYTLTQADLPVGECTSFVNTAMIDQTEQTTDAAVQICPDAASTR